MVPFQAFWMEKMWLGGENPLGSLTEISPWQNQWIFHTNNMVIKKKYGE